jgi:polyphosphate glucokinase
MPSPSKPSSIPKPAKAFVGPHTLSIDIGGTGLKASVLDVKGTMEMDRVRVETPDPFTPPVMVETLSQLIKPLPAFDRVSIGFPGVVREGRIITAPHFGNEIWKNFAMAETLQKKWGKPVRILNDADMQGLAVIAGKGLELVVTLGTGVGTALFRNGELMPHLELAQHPVYDNKTYNEYIGDKVLKKKGPEKWNKRVIHALKLLETLINYDRIYVGGGNATQLTLKPPANMKIVSNQAGILGGIALWNDRPGHPGGVRE